MGDGSSPTSGWVEDMIALPDLTETAILENLRKRYASHLIYTYTGTILVAMNPYETLDSYNISEVKKYSGRRLGDNPPHIFALAESTISDLRNNKCNQSVIISGESGAGKSESTKYILSYLTAVTSNYAQDSWVQQQILEANTVLESFGNAKTVRNNNSSRFGKFIQVQLNNQSQIVGATVVSYLLEKSRVSKQSKDERNYHIFYELLSGASDHEKEQYKLQNPDQYNYLSQSGCVSLPGVSDKEQFEGLKLALTVLNTPEEDMEAIFRLLAAILWIGNINFLEERGSESVRIANPEVLEVVAKLVDVSTAKLSKAFCFRKLTVRNESTMVPLKMSQAMDNRDNVAKSIYDNLFQRILEFINNSLLSKVKETNFIGVLDIFGFEAFETNSFEQLCINYTNEKLQYFFNEFIFKIEQDEYSKEEIIWSKVEFVDNQPCLDLIEAKPFGILSMLDEETKVPKGSDESFLSKLIQQNEKHKYFVKPKTAKGGFFGVKHYAGEVLYTVTDFLDKNKDAVQEELLDVIQGSTNAFISNLFPKRVDESQTKGAKGGGKTTAGISFKNQLASLVTTLNSTSTHYVRCIKPNTHKKSFEFEDDMVIAQLRYSGMLETIKIRKGGYPLRIPYQTFVQKFRCLSKSISPKDTDYKKTSIVIVNSAEISSELWQGGKTKMFLKIEAMDVLDIAANKILKKSAIIIQKNVRKFMIHKKFLAIKKSTPIIQRYVRGFLYVRRYQKMKVAAIKIQSAVRGWFARDYLNLLRYEAAAAEAERERLAREQQLKEQAEREAAALAASQPVPVAEVKPDSLESLKAEAAEDAEKLIQIATVVQKIKGDMEKERENSPSPQKDPDNPQLDDMFSFLGDYDGGNEIAKMAANITSEIDAMFDKPDTSHTGSTDKLTKSPPPINTSQELLSNVSSQENLSSGGLSRGKTLKVNPLIKKDNTGSSESLTTPKFNPDLPEYSMHAYASKHFQTTIKKKENTLSLGFGAKKTKSQPVDIEESLRYSKAAITASITRLPQTEHVQTIAIECFKNLMRILDPNPKKSEEIPHIMQQVIMVGLEEPEVRDEIYVQIIKQITPPKDDEPKGWKVMQLRGWEMITLSTGTFPPSKNFSKFLLAFILRAINQYATRDPRHKLALIAETSLKHSTINGARRLPPSLTEIAAIQNGNDAIPCKFYLLNGVFEELPVASVTTAGDIIKEISKRLGLRDHFGWSLFEVTWKSEHAIKANEYMADLISSLERESKGSSNKSASLLKRFRKRRDAPSSGSAAAETQFVFKKRVFKNPQELILDPVEHNLIYCQVVDNVNKDMYPISERDAVRLAALRAQALLGDCDAATAPNLFSQNINEWIAARITSGKDKEYLAKSIVEHYSHMRGTTALQAKFLYLELARTFLFYGASLFQVEYKGFWTFGEHIILSVSSYGVQFVQETTKEVIMVFSYKNINVFEAEDEILSISVEKLGTANDDFEPGEVYVFSSAHAEEIASLMREYAPSKLGKTRERIYTDQDIISLRKAVERTRHVLLDSNLLRQPGPESLAFDFSTAGSNISGGERMTFRGSMILSKNRLSKKSRSSSMMSNESLNHSRSSMDSLGDPMLPSAVNLEYGEADWSYSTTRLISSIMATVPGLEIEDFGVYLHSMIIAYGGITLSTSPTEPHAVPYANHIQSMLEKCIAEPRFSNELYMQLIKMTTHHPEPDSRQALQFWKLMSVSVGVVLPHSPEVLEYLKAHLRRYMAVDLKTKKYRQASASCARYCLKTLHRTMASGSRKSPPSSEEIMYTTRQSPINIRFQALTGQQRVIAIDPADTIETIFVSLLDKFGLLESIGYAIFRVFAGTEVALYAEDKISDILYKCEKAAANAKSTEKVIFVMKKRLWVDSYLPAPNEIEEEFIRAQVLDDIRNDLFPISLEDCIYVTALNAQAIFGDSKTANLSYRSLVLKFIPKRYHSAEVEALVVRRHQELAGKSSQEARVVLMDFLRSRPLFGATIFSAMQSYTNQIPSECWIGVSMRGIHIMARHAKTPLVSHTYTELSSYSPAKKSILFITGSAKYVFTTDHSLAIAALIKDYIDIQTQM
ncbi:cytochrome c oxidase subunit 1 [Blyttiomyces sp. JEL0837]|nr:cytochrome c oxidase subunit 1 [Blyttiomyces sp. JEL0837]